MLLRDRLLPVLGLGAIALAAPAVTLLAAGDRRVSLGGTFHFYGVGVGALAAAAAAVSFTAAGVRHGDGRTVLVGTAFTVMAGLLSVHGISTPGVLVGRNGVISLTGALTLPVGGALLALTAVPALRRPSGIRALLVFDVLAFVGIVGLGATATAAPSLVPAVPAPGSLPALVALAAGLVFYGLLMLRTVKTYLRRRRQAARPQPPRADRRAWLPGRRRAAMLALDTRVLAVCDVYDALVSARVYRAAWPQERALEHLRAEVGSAFDARCVAPLEPVLARERDVVPAPAPQPVPLPQPAY